MHYKPLIPRISNRHTTNAQIYITVSGLSKSGFAQLNNVSFEGLSFQSPFEYNNTQVITINIPVVKPDFEVIAEIAWRRRNASGFLAGVKFLQVEKGYRMKMLEQLTFIESYRKKVLFDEDRKLSCEQAYSELRNYYQYQRH
jgi:hypothetical protein